MSARNNERIISSLRGRRLRAQTAHKRGKLFCGEGESQLLGLKVPLRNYDDIQRQIKIELMQPEILAHHPLYTVARHCVSHLLADSQPQADAAFGNAALAQEQDETLREMLLALLVTSGEFRALEQPALLVPS
jgi:hypothetical protein